MTTLVLTQLPPAAKRLPVNLVEQLELSRQTLAAKGLPLNLVSYSAAAPLDTEDAVRSVKAQFLDDSVMVPQYDGVDAFSFRLVSIHDQMQAFQAGQPGRNSQNVVANIQSMVFPIIKVGQKALDVTWEGQGREFQTKLIYDANGVVYDNLLSNLASIEANALPSEMPPRPPERAGSASTAARANQSWSTRFLDYTIKWVWGSTRGKIQMDHYVITCDGWRSFCDDGGAVNAWMSVGRAAGSTRRNALRKPRISKLAWGYGWATPTASFSIKWNAHNATFSVSISGVGSAGRGSGIHSII